MSEKPLTTIAEMADSLVEAVLNIRAPRVVLLGHCAGGLIAFELAHRLSKVSRSLQLGLLVIACEAPTKTAPQVPRPFLTMPLPDLIGYLRSVGNTPDWILGDEELMDLLAPAFRADLNAAETYADNTTRDVLTIPIVVLAEELESSYLNWQSYTSGSFRFEQMDIDGLLQGATRDRGLVARLEQICSDIR